MCSRISRLAASPTSSASLIASLYALMAPISRAWSLPSWVDTSPPMDIFRRMLTVGVPSRKRILPMSFSACFISSIARFSKCLWSFSYPQLAHISEWTMYWLIAVNSSASSEFNVSVSFLFPFIVPSRKNGIRFAHFTASPHFPLALRHIFRFPKGYDGRMASRAYFATTSKGLEGVLAEEITALGGKHAEISTGGVSFSGDGDLCYRANLWLRTANRVLLTLSSFPAPSPEALYEGVKAVPWPDLFSVRRRIAVEAAVRDSGLTHSHYAAQKAKDAVVDRFREAVGKRPDVDPVAPEVRIHLRILRDACTLSIDTSGESLNRRGYRADPAEASLRETLAAGIVLLSQWDGRLPLADPACGAGTLLIEAALHATRTAPGSLRSSCGFQNLSDYRPKLWASIVAGAGEAVLHGAT